MTGMGDTVIGTTQVARYAALARQLAARLGPVLNVLLPSRVERTPTSTPSSHHRLTGATKFVGHL